MGLILLIVLVLLVLGALPLWPYSAGWATTRAAGSACSCCSS